jgi:hypothetical protein
MRIARREQSKRHAVSDGLAHQVKRMVALNEDLLAPLGRDPILKVAAVKRVQQTEVVRRLLPKYKIGLRHCAQLVIGVEDRTMITGGLQPGCKFGQGLQNQLGKDGLLARKVEIDGALSNLGALRDRIHRCPAEAILGEDDPRCSKDVLPATRPFLFATVDRSHDLLRSTLAELIDSTAHNTEETDCRSFTDPLSL